MLIVALLIGCAHRGVRLPPLPAESERLDIGLSDAVAHVMDTYRWMAATAITGPKMTAYGGEPRET